MKRRIAAISLALAMAVLPPTFAATRDIAMERLVSEKRNPGVVVLVARTAADDARLLSEFQTLVYQSIAD
jgi:hypothetical protein